MGKRACQAESRHRVASSADLKDGGLTPDSRLVYTERADLKDGGLTPDSRLVYAERADLKDDTRGVVPVHAWPGQCRVDPFTPDLHLIYAWFAPDLHLICT